MTPYATQPLLPTIGNASEVARLEAMLQARTNPDGTSRKGYRRNVATIRARIAQLQALDVPRTA